MTEAIKAYLAQQLMKQLMEESNGRQERMEKRIRRLPKRQGLQLEQNLQH